MSTINWLVEMNPQNTRFPYRLTLEGPDGPILCVRSKHAWPGAGAQIFCIRDNAAQDANTFVERVPVIEWSRLGARLVFALDRPTRKRAEFLFLVKSYKQREGTYEQILFRTQAGIESHRSRGKLDLHGAVDLNIVIDSAERYPWSFGPEATVRRRKLPAGDYALLVDEKIVATVERKALPNLLSDLFSPKTLHLKLAELSAYKHAAVVVEGQYGDLVNPAKIGKCSPKHLLRCVAELSASHPKVPIIWAGHRKGATVWTAQFFTACERLARNLAPESLQGTPDLFQQPEFDGGADQQIRQAALQMAPTPFLVGDLVTRLGSMPRDRVSRILSSMRDEGLLVTLGRARGIRWTLPRPAAV